MSALQSTTRATRLSRLPNPNRHTCELPSKRINDGDDLTFFFASTAYRDLTIWLLQLTRGMFPSEDGSGKVTACQMNIESSFGPHVLAVRSLLHDLVELINQAPPDTGPRRFGNVAFRKWYQLAEDNASQLLRKHIGPSLPTPLEEKTGETTLLDELKVYLLGSFGSSQRLDYGTGHELSFLAFLACLWKLGAFDPGEEQAIVVGTVQPYLALMRKLILTYTLEPAGSHGVWGLDDHSFVPYIFGSAQLGPAMSTADTTSPLPTEGSLPGAPSPSSVTNKTTVADYAETNMYFSAIQFIYDVKTGPFWEHSPVLYDISGIKDGWGKINKGMLKMYVAEVLGKFPVVQHFPFGSLFPWERDPEARETSASMHVQQQPPQSKDVPPVVSAAGAGTAAPWARRGNSAMPQMQASTGLSTTRRPWAPATANDRRTLLSTTSMPAQSSVRGASASSRPSNGGPMASTPAPWSESNQQSSAGDMPSTKAPWAEKDASK